MKKWPVLIVVLLTFIFAFMFLTAGTSVGGSIPSNDEIASDTVSVSFVTSTGAPDSIELNRGDKIIGVPDGLSMDGWYVSGDETMRVVDLENLTVYQNITLHSVDK